MDISHIIDKITPKFLQKVSRSLIDLYKKKKYTLLKNIYTQLYSAETNQTTGHKKIFYTLIKLYHPDNYTWHIRELDSSSAENNKDKINFYQKFIAIRLFSGTGLIYKHKESYAFDQANDDSLDGLDININEEVPDHDLFSIITQLYLGNTTTILEPIDLEQITGELILSNCNISDLDGIQFCLSITSLDISENNIDNIYELNNLTQLEELNCSNNHIDDIESLKDLKMLETLYVDNNQIEDISPLLHLERLQFVSMINNPITSMDDIYTLKENGVIVVYF